MGGLVQNVEISAWLETEDGEFPFNSTLNVVDGEVRRVFGGAGSEAEISVIFDDLLGLEDEKQLRMMVDQGVVSSARRPHQPDSVYDMNDHFVGVSPQARRDQEATLKVEVEVTNMTSSGVVEIGPVRLFTGTLISVKQDEERVVTFEALDRRHDLNRYMVKLDTTSNPQPSTDIIRGLLGQSDEFGQGLQLEEGEDFIIDIGNDRADIPDIFEEHIDTSDPGPELIKDTWGVDGHATVWEVLRDISRVEGATMFIDGENTFYFTDWPDHIVWGANTMSPVVEWESGDDETSRDILVESPYDQSGLGMYAPVSGERQESRIEDNKEIGRELSENNVFTRRALENIRTWESITTELMRDSGKIHTLGDPRIEPYDEFIIDDDVIDGFAPISQGQYTAKRVYHRFSGDDGYITELHLGTDTEELFNKFADEEVMENSQATETGDLSSSDIMRELGGQTFAPYIPF